jgi:hypothetical protein
MQMKLRGKNLSRRRSLVRCAVAAAAAWAFIGSPNAAVVTAVGNVTVIVTYADWGNGDFTFRTSSMPASCYGYWISPSQPGFKTLVAFILKAHATGEPVLVGADNALIWNGSASTYCKVDYVATPY